MEAKIGNHIGWSRVRPQSGLHTGPWMARRETDHEIFSDAALVRRAREEDYSAFDALVARYRCRLYSMAMSSLGNEREAGDALCEMVLSAFRDLRSVRATCSPGTWLHLHGLRAVIARMKASPGKYTIENCLGAGAISPSGH